MPRFSIGRAIGDAFSLAMRRPFSLLVWGAAIVAPVVATYALVLPALAEMPMDGSAHETQQSMVRAMAEIEGPSSLISLIQLLLTVMVYAAIYRSILRPRESGFFSMRLGMDELRVTVAGLAIAVGIWVGIVMVAILAGVLVFTINAMAGPNPAIMIGLGIGGLLTLVVLWAMARVSLIPPASLMLRDFAFGEGWDMARGNMWRLFGLMVLTWLINLAIQMVMGALLVGAFVSGIRVSQPELLGDTAELMRNLFPLIYGLAQANLPWVIVGSVVASWLAGLTWTLSIAPFASACRQLAPARPAPTPEPAPVPTPDPQPVAQTVAPAAPEASAEPAPGDSAHPGHDTEVHTASDPAPTDTAPTDAGATDAPHGDKPA